MQVDTSGTTQVANPKPYYHCKQNNPTAKPKAKSHPYRGLVGWVPKTKDSMHSAAEATPIEDSSAGSPKRRIL
jgi:hypothetical protein